VPELPDITVYIDHLESRLVGQTLARVRLLNPFVLRSVTPPIAAALLKASWPRSIDELD
jgi:formamidopyrimidine-DNA glycosylase